MEVCAAAAAAGSLSHEEVSLRLEGLRRLRRGHVDACSAALRGADPQAFGHFLRREATDLADQASAVLSENATASPAERMPALRLLEQRAADALQVIGDARGKTLRAGALAVEERARARRDLRMVHRIRQRACVAREEAEARTRLERFLGPRALRRFETLLLFLIFAFIVLVGIEWRLTEVPRGCRRCTSWTWRSAIVFQVDFFLRWGFARWSRGYFLRHFFFESLPALPYGLIFHHLPRATISGPWTRCAGSSSCGFSACVGSS